MRFKEGEMPQGFMQKDLKSIGATIPMPQEWFFNTQIVNTTHAFFITKENLQRRGHFSTGLTLQAFIHGAASLKTTPEKFVLDMEKQEPFAKGTQSFASFGVERSGGLISVRRIIATTEERFVELPVYERPGDKDLVRAKPIHQLIQVIGNERTGTLYVATFESPSESWRENLPIGEDMLDNLKLRRTR